ncbi:MAG: VOC family protein [Bryobacterales bacterium]|nr:VOC family protein [Bryobacterales bacterium]
MLKVLAVLAASLPLAGADMKVDHITIAGRDLPAMRKTFAEAGIITEYGGKHSNGITEMALSSFPDGSYLELIAPIMGADASPHYWGAFMAKNAGPCAWAIRSTNLEPAIARLKKAGIPTDPEKAGRKRPDGVQLKWETATVGPPPQGSFFPFMIADETPRELRAYPTGKPTTNAIGGVRFVVVAVRNLPEAIAKYRAAFELPAPRQQDDTMLGAHLAWFPGTPAILASPSNDNTWLAERLKQFGEIPCAFVFDSAAPWTNAVSGQSTWFSRRLNWIDPKALNGARIAFD